MRQADEKGMQRPYRTGTNQLPVFLNVLHTALAAGVVWAAGAVP